MTFANLNINIIANGAQAQAALRGTGETARTEMLSAGAAVDDFRTQFQRTGADMQQAQQQIGAGMRAANDAIVTSSAQSEKALTKLATAADSVDTRSMAEKVGAAVGAGMGVGYVAAQTWVEKTEALVKAKAKVIAIGLAIAAVSATAGVVYGAYRLISGSLGFITGLFTGSSYESASIDKLIALNNQVKDLQTNLHLSAQEAAAMLDATSRLGVDKADLSTVYKAAEAAMRTNGEELDRLGVKYKDSNGHLLTQQQFLSNVKRELDAYAEGWDRTSAAAAIGAGTFEQITAVLKITEAELQASADRLNDYGNGFGPERQAAVAAYEQAMREFKNEVKLTGDGFAGAIADQIMPALTSLATFFRDGFPFAVRAFRYSMATVTSLLYGLKTVFDIVADAGIGTVTVLADGFMALGTAAVRALKGDMAGASQALTAGWHKAGATVSATMDEIVGDATKNRDAMLLAWGLDDRTVSLAEARANRIGKAGKTFTPAPKKEATATASAGSAFANYLAELDRMISKTTESEYASMRLKAEQLAAKEGITDLTEAYRKIAAVQSGESTRAVDAYLAKLAEEGDAFRFETDMIGLSTDAQAKLTQALRKRLEVENLIMAAKKAGKPLTDEDIARLQKELAAATAKSSDDIDARTAKSRDFATGAADALEAFYEKANNQAAYARDLIGGSLDRLQDAFINFAKTGKLHLGSLFGFMAEEYLRNLMRMQMAGNKGAANGPLGSLFGLLGLVSGGTTGMALGAVTGATGDFARMDRATPLASGISNVPFDGYPAILHEGERVMTRAQNLSFSSGNAGQAIVINNGPLSVGAGVSMAQVASAVNVGNMRTIEQVRRLQRQGKFA